MSSAANDQPHLSNPGRSSKAAWAAVGVAFLGVVAASTVGYFSISATRTAQRPHVQILATPTWPRNITAKGGMSLLLHVDLKASGQSPATNVSYWVSSLWASDPDTLRIGALHRRKCSEGRGELPDLLTISSGETRTSQYLTSMSDAEASSARRPPTRGSNVFHGFLIVCAYYDAPSTGAHYTTSAVYMLSQRTKSNTEDWAYVGGLAE
jgi:hypothetical protein